MRNFSFITDKGKNYSVRVPTPKPRFERKFVFSFHKSGSTLLNNLLSTYCRVEGTPMFSLYDQAFEQGLSTDELGDEALPCLGFDGIVYTGFRHFPRFSLDIGNSTAIWLVRDPRDMVVSMYYSVTRSHVIPKGNLALVKTRENAAQMSIDDFVLQRIRQYVGQFNRYRENLAGKHVKVYRYEDVIYEKQAWFKDVLETLEIPHYHQLAARVVRKLDVIPLIERKGSHVRQVHPGNHKKKLAPQTIDRLSEQAKPILDHFNYR